MGFFQPNEEEILTFFAVLVRFGTMMAVLPFVGDTLIPPMVKVLLSLAVSAVLYPMLVGSGQVHPGEAAAWGSSAWGIVSTVGAEALFGLAVGFSARVVFDAINMGGNIAGTFMGFASASQFDPHQEAQTQVVAQFQIALATLAFLALDGHHLMLRAALGSYEVVGLGRAAFGGGFVGELTRLTGEMMRLALQIAAPMALSLFAVNVVYAVIAKAMPQLNVLILSFSVSALIGLFVMVATIGEFGTAASELFAQLGDRMSAVMRAMKGS